MNNYIPVEGMDGHFRDKRTGAIINKNNFEYQSYVKKRERLSEERKKINSLQEEVSSLKNDVDDIKSMLVGITNLLKQDHK